MTSAQVTLAVAEPSDFPLFKSELQAAFAVSVVETFGKLPDGPIPSDADLDHSLSAPNAVVLRVLCAGQVVGGVVLSIDAESHQNSLALFFISIEQHGRGLGYAAWQAIERRYPDTIIWTTHTPYFEKRNIHFYVNKCGFKIVKFYSAKHPYPHGPGGSDLPGGDDGFGFEKVMKPGKADLP